MDADLIGVPYRVTVGARGLKEGIVEIKERASGTVDKIKVAEAADYLAARL
jgi:prolyl-tRNA synthetase